MAISIKDPESDRLARDLAAATGETLTGAIREALRERLERIKARPSARPLARELEQIAKRASSLPVLDDRGDDEILGFDESGLPR